MASGAHGSEHGENGSGGAASAPAAGVRALPTHGFLYRQVATELRRRLAGGVYPAGHAIPSETELVREFGVSAITVRRAIRDLTVEGALFGRQGLGVFVADRRRIVRVLSGDPRTSIGDEIRRAGLEPGIKELSSGPVTDPAVARRLGLAPRTRLWRHEKLILADGEPVSLDVVHLPGPLADRLRDDLAHDFMFQILTRHGIPVGRSDYRFEGGAVPEDQAALLGLAVRSPLILVGYTLHAPDGAPILTGITIARSDRFTFALSLPGEPAPDAPPGRTAPSRGPRG